MDSNTLTLRERENARFLQTYRRLPIEIDYAEGMEIVANDGTRYIDFLGGIAVNAAGHSHPAIIEAVTRQMHRYAHVSNLFYQDAQIEFVERLTRLSGYSRAFLTNSGTEANEGALKLARSWGAAKGRKEIVGFTGGFHGRTYGVLSIMEKPLYKEGMGPFLGETSVLPFNDVEALLAHLSDQTCAVFVEALQGEGGVRWMSEEFAAALIEAKGRHGFLIVADEVQAGCGRTGPFFSFERFGLTPEIVTTAKVLGGGLPLGAIVTIEELAEVWSYGRHGTTFGGNAVSCAAGAAFLDLYEEELQENVGLMGTYLLHSLERLAALYPTIICDIRGGGLMIGLEFDRPTADIVARLLSHGIIANATNENVLRLLPPYIIKEIHVDMLVEALGSILATIEVAAG